MAVWSQGVVGFPATRTVALGSLVGHSRAAPGRNRRCHSGERYDAGVTGRGTPGATVRARMPSVALSALSGRIGKAIRSR
jgi:hypothetical protein